MSSAPRYRAGARRARRPVPASGPTLRRAPARARRSDPPPGVGPLRSLLTTPAASAAPSAGRASCCATPAARTRTRCTRSSASSRVDAGGDGGYGYLIYPHRPIVAYDTGSGELLSEYCVALPRPRRAGRAASGCPTPTTCSPSGWRCAATSARLIADANMHLPGPAARSRAGAARPRQACANGARDRRPSAAAADELSNGDDRGRAARRLRRPRPRRSRAPT